MTNRLLWIHGWGMSSRIWEDAPVLLPDAEHHFFTYSGCDTVEEMRRSLSDAVLRLGEGCMLAGWSMGGMLALEKIMDCGLRDFIRAVIVVGGTLKFADKDRSKGWEPRIVERMRSRLEAEREETLDRFAVSMLTPAERGNGGWADRVRQLTRETDFTRGGLADGLTYLLESDLRQDWAAFHSAGGGRNVFWLHGSDDPICPVGAVPELPAGRLAIVPAAGHVPVLTARDPVFHRIKAILEEGTTP